MEKGVGRIRVVHSLEPAFLKVETGIVEIYFNKLADNVAPHRVRDFHPTVVKITLRDKALILRGTPESRGSGPHRYF